MLSEAGVTSNPGRPDAAADRAAGAPGRRGAGPPGRRAAGAPGRRGAGPLPPNGSAKVPEGLPDPITSHPTASGRARRSWSSAA